MTINACIVCGEIGNGILIPCRNCSYKPTTSWEMAFAIFNSDHSKSVEIIKKTGDGIRERYTRASPVWFRFSDLDEQELNSFLAHPDGRDILELKRFAKDGFFRKQLDFHYIGPDGYEHELKTRGKEISKPEFDEAKGKFSDFNVFMVSAYRAGIRLNTIIPKDIWYGLKDHFLLLDRLLENESKMLSTISAHARHHTLKYLASRGFDFREKQE